MKITVNEVAYEIKAEKQPAKKNRDDLVDLTCYFDGRSCSFSATVKDIKKDANRQALRLLERFEDPAKADAFGPHMKEIGALLKAAV